MNSFDQPPQETQETQPAQDAGPGFAPVPAPPPPDPYASFPPDLRVPWKGADLGLFVLIYLGINIVLGLVAFLGGAAAFHLSLDTLKNDPVAFPVVAVIAQVLISAATILYFWILVRIRRAQSAVQPPEGFWRTMGLRPLGQSATRPANVLYCLLGGVALSLAVATVSDFMGKQPPTPFEDLLQSRPALIMLIFFGVLVAPLVEEMMFRGFLYPVVARRFGIIAGIIFTGILFGAFHAVQLWGAWGLVALLMGVGIVFTWVRARTQTVLASTLVHIAYNSTLFVGLLIQTKGLTDLSHIR